MKLSGLLYDNAGTLLSGWNDSQPATANRQRGSIGLEPSCAFDDPFGWGPADISML